MNNMTQLDMFQSLLDIASYISSHPTVVSIWKFVSDSKKTFLSSFLKPSSPRQIQKDFFKGFSYV